MAPKIWIGSLAAYNIGRLHGVWVDAYQSVDDLRDVIRWILLTSPIPDDEEYAIFDYDEFGGLRIGEQESLEDISCVANGIAEHGEAFAAWVDCLGMSRLSDAGQTFQDAYRGRWESMEAYVEDYLSDGDAYRFMEAVPTWLQGYIHVDVERLARDWESDHYVVYRGSGGVFVFDAR